MASPQPDAIDVTVDHARLPLRLRMRSDADVLPDESSEWDDWDDDFVPEQEQPQRFRGVVEWGDRLVGSVSWSPVLYGPTHGSRAWMIGIGLAEQFRGQGVGTVAQRALAEALFAATDAHRVEASTDVENIAEQRSLERAGFTREGVLRGAQYRSDGRHHDLVMYSLVRGDMT